MRPSALAPDTGWLIAARAVQGVGSAMIMPHAMALLGVVFPRAQRAKALGIFSSVTGLGTLGGPLVGGAITEGLNWQWILWLNVPIGPLLISMVRGRIEESTGPARSLDLAGLVLVPGAALGLVWGLVRANVVGWTGLEAGGSLAAGALLLVAFIGRELRAREPMLPMRLFRFPAFSAGNAVGFLLYGALFGTAFLLTQFLQITLRYGPLGAGVRLAPWTVTVFIVSAIAGALVNRIGERALIVTGLSLQAAGFGWIAILAGPHLHHPAMMAPPVVAGCGVSLAMPAAQSAVIGSVPESFMGTAAGVFNTFRQLGGTFGIAILAAVFASFGSYASPTAFSDGFAPGTWVAAGLSFAAAIVGVWTPGGRSTVHTGIASPDSRAAPFLCRNDSVVGPESDSRRAGAVS